MWRDGGLFHAARPGSKAEPQVCVAPDLFEVIAELAGLDLEHAKHASEAIALASSAQTRLVRG